MTHIYHSIDPNNWRSRFQKLKEQGRLEARLDEFDRLITSHQEAIDGLSEKVQLGYENLYESAGSGISS